VNSPIVVVDCGSGGSRVNLIGRKPGTNALYMKPLYRLPTIVSVLKQREAQSEFINGIKAAIASLPNNLSPASVTIAATAGLRHALKKGEVSEDSQKEFVSRYVKPEGYSFLMLEGVREAYYEFLGLQALYNQSAVKFNIKAATEISMISMGGRSMQFACGSSGVVESMPLSVFCIREHVLAGVKGNDVSTIPRDTLIERLEQCKMLIAESSQNALRVSGLVALITMAKSTAEFASLSQLMSVDSAIMKIDSEITARLNEKPLICRLDRDGPFEQITLLFLLRNILHFRADPSAHIVFKNTWPLPGEPSHTGSQVDWPLGLFIESEC